MCGLEKERVGGTCRMCIGECTLSPGRAFDLDRVPLCLMCASGTSWSKDLLSCAVLLVASAGAALACMTDPTLIGCRTIYTCCRVFVIVAGKASPKVPSVDQKCGAGPSRGVYPQRGCTCARVGGMLSCRMESRIDFAFCSAGVMR